MKIFKNILLVYLFNLFMYQCQIRKMLKYKGNKMKNIDKNVYVLNNVDTKPKFVSE